MALIWPGFKFRVSLGGHEPRMGIQFDHLDNPSIRRYTGESHSVFNELLTVIVVDLLAVTMAFINFPGTVKPISFGIRIKNTFIGAKP